MDTFVVALIAKLTEELGSYDALKVIKIILATREEELLRGWQEV